MHGKIIQKGTGYCVGEIEGNNLYIHREFFSDPVLDATIDWEEDEYNYVLAIARSDGQINMTMIKDLEELRQRILSVIQIFDKHAKFKVLKFKGVVDLAIPVEVSVEDISFHDPYDPRGSSY